jgi:hypothetical protein
MIPSTRRLIVALASLVALGLVAPRPAAAAEKQVVCKDGTKDDGGRGACSGHGGIDQAATDKADKAAAAKEAKAKDKKEKEDAKAKEKQQKDEAKARKDAEKAKQPAEPKAAKGHDESTTVTCEDGTTSKGGRGACSGHGGIKEAAPVKASAEKSEKAAKPATHTAEKPASAAKEPRASGEKADPAKGPPTARCKDGSLSYSEHHSGACSNHGGVEEWLDKK